MRAAKMFQKAYFRYKKQTLFRNMRNGVKAIQNLFRIRRENLEFIQVRKSTKKIQRWWRTILENRRLAKFQSVVCTIQKWWKMHFLRVRYIQMKAAIIMINRVLRGARARLQKRKVKYCRDIVENIVERSAELIVQKMEIKAAKTIQRYAKGYIVRNRYRVQVKKIQKAKRDFVKNKKIKIIQRNVRGFIARSSYKRIRKAAMLIQGHMRMKWLSSLFQRLRGVSVVLQKAVRRWLILRKVMNERMQGYMVNEGLNFRARHIVEQANFFGLDNVTKTGKINDPLQFSMIGKIKTVYININCFLEGQENTLYENESYGTTSAIPFFAPDLSPMSNAAKAYSLEAHQTNSGAILNEVLNKLYSQNTHPNTTRGKIFF